MPLGFSTPTTTSRSYSQQRAAGTPHGYTDTAPGGLTEDDLADMVNDAAPPPKNRGTHDGSVIGATPAQPISALDLANAGGAFAVNPNAARIAQLRAELLNIGSGGGGGGNGAAAALARNIAALQNRSTDIDIGQAQNLLGSIAGTKQNARDVFRSRVEALGIERQIAKLQYQDNLRGYTNDATARGARTAVGTRKEFASLLEQLANSRATNTTRHRALNAEHRDTMTGIDQKGADLYAKIAKLAIQKQINDEQAKGAGLGGGGGNPLAAFAAAMRKSQIQDSIFALQTDPRKIGAHFATSIQDFMGQGYGRDEATQAAINVGLYEGWLNGDALAALGQFSAPKAGSGWKDGRLK